MASTKHTEITAILGEEFSALIDALGVREEFDRGDCSCDFCGKTLDTTNILLLFPKPDRKIGFLCADPVCAIKYNHSA